MSHQMRACKRSTDGNVLNKYARFDCDPDGSIVVESFVKAGASASAFINDEDEQREDEGGGSTAAHDAYAYDSNHPWLIRPRIMGSCEVAESD